MKGERFVDAFLSDARKHYVRLDGTQTGYARNLEVSLRWFRRIEDVSSLGLAELKEYREWLVGRGFHARTVNQYVSRVKAAFRWGAERELLPADVAARLMVLRPLRTRAGGARERGSLDLGVLVRIADRCSARVGAMLRVHWLAGMRPGEVCGMRWEFIRRESPAWIYAPVQHKVAHHGLRRWIVLVDEAVAQLGKPKERGPVFVSRRGAPFTVGGYRQALGRACRALGVRPISPNEVRRSAATEARRLLGAEHAQRLLGHASTTMTEHYFDLGWMDQVDAVGRLVDAGWTLRRETRRRKSD